MERKNVTVIIYKKKKKKLLEKNFLEDVLNVRFFNQLYQICANRIIALAIFHC